MAKQLPQVAHSKMYNASQVVYIGPCILVSVLISGDGAAGDCDVYDGTNSNEERKCHLEVPSGESFQWSPGQGTDLDKGIYLAVNAATTFVTITWIPESWKEFI